MFGFSTIDLNYALATLVSVMYIKRVMEKISKFGLGYCDLPTMIWNVSAMLRILTLNIDNRKKRVPILFYILTVTLTTCYFYVYFVSVIWFSFYYCRLTNDKISAIVVFSLGAASLIGVFKLFCLYLYQNKVRNIVAEYLTCDNFLIPGSRLAKNILKVSRYVKKRAITFWIAIISNGVIYALTPIVTPGRHLPEDNFILYRLDPILESPNYEIAYLLSIAGITVTVYITSNITAFMIIIVGYTEAQMTALSQEILHIWDDAIQHYNNNLETIYKNDQDNKSQILNAFVSDRLKDVVKIHTVNIHLLHKVEELFRGAIAIEFMILIVGLIVELLGGLENTYMEIPFTLMQVAVDCFTGQRLIDASVLFENSVYFCKWENFDNRNMKTILIILLNAQKTLKLSAGGVTTLSFESLMAVFKNTYSAFTTLRSTFK